MMDVGNNLGKERKCKLCSEKEDIEHIIECQQAGARWQIEKSWLKETDNIVIVRKMNDFVQFITENRENKQ